MIKKFITVLTFGSFIITPAMAITVEDVTSPISPSYRLGTGLVPEKAYKVVETKKQIPTRDASYDAQNAVKDLTYADLSLKKISKEISDDLDLESEQTLNDIKLLWIGAAQKSETIKFIIYKLANPDEDKPKTSIVKKIVKPLATAGSLAGIGVGNPIAAVSAIMGSSVLGNLSVDEKEMNYKFSKVNDADMVVLIRKVEELQRKIVIYYFDYMAARSALIRTDEIVQKRKKLFVQTQNKSKEQILMADSFYRESLQMQSIAKADFLSKRSALEQIVGLDAMAEFEEVLAHRQK